MVTHTERYCNKFLNDSSENREAMSKEWGVWLKAPPRRVAGSARSKWLREEDDANWGGKSGTGIGIPKFGGSSYNGGANSKGYGEKLGNKDKGPVFENTFGGNGNQSAGVMDKGIGPINNYGPEEEELVGLNSMDRK